jgi:UDP-glucose 4-epimerase
MSKILVIGGCGFIGSHLVEKLLSMNHSVTVIDDLSVGNIHNLSKHPNLRMFTTDILDNNYHHFKDIDTVYHLAALTRPQESIIDPVQTTLVNVVGTVKILEYCRKCRVRKMLFTSSTSMYGEQDILPTPETVIPNPMSPYALTKQIGEQYCKLYEKMYGMQINSIRPFNVYGPRQNPNGTYGAAVPKFIDKLSKGERPWITGDGTQARDFIYVEDVVDLMIAITESDISGEAFNAGSGTNTSINELYEIIGKLMKKIYEPDYIDPVFEPKQTLGDMTKVKTLLNWKAKYTLEEGLKKTIQETIK